MDFDELVEEFTDDMRFEGDSGCENLEALCEALGYEGHRFRFGSPLEHFLSDNPGAQEALVEWLTNQNLTDWKDKLQELHDRANEKEEPQLGGH